MTQILWRQQGRWRQAFSINALDLPGRVISLVGGGGKTTLLYRLAENYRDKGQKTAVLTTTKIYRPDSFCTTPQDCQARWAAGNYAVCGEAFSAEKLGPPARPLLDWLLEQADILLIEADGAKRKACKMPGDHEPVLLPACDTVVGVLGLDAVGQPVGEVCFRPELVCEFLRCSMDHRLTPQDSAAILLSPQGTRKDVGGRHYTIVLNKCDDEQRLIAGKNLIQQLEGRGHTRTFLTRFQ